MTHNAATSELASKHRELLAGFLAETPASQGAPATAQAPAIADVMGGIGEDSGSLVLTATLGLSFFVSLWQTPGDRLTIRFVPESGAGSAKNFSMPLASISASPQDGQPILDKCTAENATWAAPICLTIHRAIASGLAPRPKQGLAALVVTDFPPEVDLGRPTVMASATMEALCRLNNNNLDRADKSRLCSDAVSTMTGVWSLRTAMTALAGCADGSLLQIRFQPQPSCEPLSLPPGIAILATRTSLGRPVSAERLVDTRLCAEMGHRVIQASFGGDGQADAIRIDRLSAISPTEYVERYRDIIPSKMTGKQFVAKFGEFRGLNGTLAPGDVYKIRSRAEHHIYENRRVHEFATALNRAKRTNAMAAMIEAGELMYASHWSHSQRCGIGGVETDRLATCIRKHGPAAGLFGAKVTGGGNGGEMVVLMRDDPQSHAALAAAINEAQLATHKTIHTYRGSLAGAELATVV